MLSLPALPSHTVKVKVFSMACKPRTIPLASLLLPSFLPLIPLLLLSPSLMSLQNADLLASQAQFQLCTLLFSLPGILFAQIALCRTPYLLPTFAQTSFS